jgi:oligopeptide transport system substrate-binding protein
LNRQRSRWLATALVAVVVAGVPIVGSADSPQSAGGGGEIIDGGTFSVGPPEHIDPALNTTLNSFQFINAVFDGLTEIDDSDPESIEIVPHLAESFESNEDATEWAFVVKEGQQFSDGEPILPSTFKRSWERAAALAGDYSYLMNFIEGGEAAVAGEADEISGVVADDEAMTLTVTLSAPYANFPALAGFQTFMPTPEAAVEAGADWENQLMVGNGPYGMESPRNDQEIVLVRNDEWLGDANGETWPERAERIVLQINADVDTSYNALEAGETDIARIPGARAEEARSNWGTTLDVSVLGSYYYVFNFRDPRFGGEENLLLRQAISMAINRETINEAVYNGTRTLSTGVTPPGIPGFLENICEYCTYDPEGAAAAYEEWQAAGNSIDDPLPVMFNAGSVHELVTDIIVENLAAVGIPAEPDPRVSETYFSELADGACGFCRVGWIADYPTYDNFLFDIFGTEALDGNNYGYSNPDFDALVAEGKATTDEDARNASFNEAEQLLLNTDTMVVPINWYLGDYAFNPDTVPNFGHGPMFLIPWERITVTK